MPTLPTGRPLGAPTSPHLSPAHAAQLAKVSRRTIMRAIEAGELPAFRDNRNRWQIIRQELENWAGAQWAPNEQRPPNAYSDAHIAQPDAHLSKADRGGLDRDSLADDLVAARLTIAQLEARLEERAALVSAAEARAQMAEADRDSWRALAEKLTDRLAERPAVLPPEPEPPPRRWWSWTKV